jgi:hypothetical protein
MHFDLSIQFVRKSAGRASSITISILLHGGSRVSVGININLRSD